MSRRKKKHKIRLDRLDREYLGGELSTTAKKRASRCGLTRFFDDGEPSQLPKLKVYQFSSAREKKKHYKIDFFLSSLSFLLSSSVFECRSVRERRATKPTSDFCLALMLLLLSRLNAKKKCETQKISKLQRESFRVGVELDRLIISHFQTWESKREGGIKEAINHFYWAYINQTVWRNRWSQLDWHTKRSHQYHKIKFVFIFVNSEKFCIMRLQLLVSTAAVLLSLRAADCKKWVSISFSYFYCHADRIIMSHSSPTESKSKWHILIMKFTSIMWRKFPILKSKLCPSRRRSKCSYHIKFHTRWKFPTSSIRRFIRMSNISHRRSITIHTIIMNFTRQARPYPSPSISSKMAASTIFNRTVLPHRTFSQCSSVIILLNIRTLRRCHRIPPRPRLHSTMNLDRFHSMRESVKFFVLI